MADSSVKNIIDCIKKNNLMDEEYTNIASDLLSYTKAIYSDNTDHLDYIASSLAKYSYHPKISLRFDIPFLTLSKGRVKTFLQEFGKIKDRVLLRRLGDFKVDPEGLFKRLDFCTQYGIPFKDENDVLFNEINYSSESNLYLRGLYLKETPNNGLTEEEAETFIKVCATLQRYFYENEKVKLFITKELEDNIVTEVKSNPNLTVDEIAKIVVEKTFNLSSPVDENYISYNEDMDRIYPRNGNR